MSTITEKLNTVETSVSDIKQAIVNKGGTISGNITTYASAITNLPSGGGSAIINQNEAGISPIYAWQGTEEEWNDSGELKDWYNWKSSEIGGNYTVVGSPTISDDFIASGFSLNNYLVFTLPNYSAGSVNSFEIKVKVHTPTSTTTYGRVFNGSEAYDNIALALGSVDPSFSLNDDNFIYFADAIELDKDMWIKVTYNGSVVSLLYSYIGDKDYITSATKEVDKSAIYFTSGTYSIGRRLYDGNTGCIFNGSVDLSQSLFVINGKEVWRGADNLKVYTDTTTPTTESTVYSSPAVESTLTITDVGESDIVLSDMNVYDRNESGDTTTTKTIGEAHPDYLSFIDGVGVRIGTTDIADLGE